MTTGSTAEPSESVPERVVEKRRPKRTKKEVVSKVWQLATMLIPIILTTWLTYWVSQKEDKIRQDIDNQSQLFSQQLHLSEELYKRRFDAYEKLYAQLVQLNERLETTAGADPGQWNKTNADQVAQFNQLLDLSKLHMSPKVEDLTADAWKAGAQGNSALLTQSIQNMEETMKTELNDWMLAKKEASAAEGAPSTPKKSKKLKTRSSQ